jgi:hypothetical protein
MQPDAQPPNGQFKSLREIIVGGRRYALRTALASVALGLAWQALRGGDWDMLGLRLVTAAFIVCAAAVLFFGGAQGGVMLLFGPGMTNDMRAQLLRDEILASDAQPFHPVQAALGAILVALLGLGVMLVG